MQLRKKWKIERWNFNLFFLWRVFFCGLVGVKDREYRWKDQQKITCQKIWKKKSLQREKKFNKSIAQRINILKMKWKW